MLYKRYQYYSNKGKVWTKWFRWNSDILDKWQINNKLLNEYKDETQLTPEELVEANLNFVEKEKKTAKRRTSKKVK